MISKLPLIWLMSVASVKCYMVERNGVEKDLNQYIPKFPNAYGNFRQGQILDEFDLVDLPHVNLPNREPRRMFGYYKVRRVGGIRAVPYVTTSDDYCTYVFMDRDAPNPGNPTDR